MMSEARTGARKRRIATSGNAFRRGVFSRGNVTIASSQFLKSRVTGICPRTDFRHSVQTSATNNYPASPAAALRSAGAITRSPRFASNSVGVS